ncbi:MAG TPA: hypothetical protein VM529_25740 [Gemmata sp.]|nr:hypothetical protein [Gemmata sp.]
MHRYVRALLALPALGFILGCGSDPSNGGKAPAASQEAPGKAPAPPPLPPPPPLPNK